MAYQKTQWKDRIVEFLRRFKMTTNQDGTITLTPHPGQIVEEGTMVTAEAMNKIEDGIEAVDQGLTSHVADNAAHGVDGKVNKAGDTMTGALKAPLVEGTIAHTSGYFNIYPYNVVYDDGSYLRSYYDGNNSKWTMLKKNADATVGQIDIELSGNLVYHAGRKPTKHDIGLGNVENVKQTSQTDFNNHKETIFDHSIIVSSTVVGAGWYRIAKFNNDGRGNANVSIYTTGGSWAPVTTTIKYGGGFLDDKQFIVETLGNVTYWTDVRATSDGTNQYLEVYFVRDVLNVFIKVNQSDGYAVSVTPYAGELAAGGGTVYNTLKLAKGITTSQNVTSVTGEGQLAGKRFTLHIDENGLFTKEV